MSDAELVAAARNGEQSAWEGLVRRHSPRLWAVARVQGLDRAAASDVVQIGWLELLKGLDSLNTPESVGAWLAAVVRREAIRTSKRHRRHEVVSETIPADLPSPDERLLSRERAAAVRSAFGQLDMPCRELLGLLSADSRLSYEQISAITGHAIGGIGPTRQRCLKKLRELLEGEPLYQSEPNVPSSERRTP
jgi:RNA polymerase sigma factor (sigma-70 family)